MPYYLIKNEWSGFWGDAGYIKLAQDRDCGTSCEAFAVIADVSA